MLGVFALEARNIKSLFVDMPDSLMPMLSTNAKKDLIDFYESNMRPTLPNEWNTTSQITLIKDNLLCLNEDHEGTITTTIAALSHKGRDTIVCLVRTIKMPQPDSQISFYTTDWKPLAVKTFINLPTLHDLQSDRKELCIIDYTAITLEPNDAGSPSIRITVDASDNTADARLKQSFLYRWNNTKFIKQP